MHKLLIYLFLSLSVTLMANEVKVHWAKDFTSGVSLAKKEHKPILFIISRDTCKYCVLLENTTLQDEKVIKILSSDFIAIRSWTNKRDYIPQELARATPGLPGIWFLNSDGTPMYQPILGYMKTQRMKKVLDIVKDTFDKKNKKSGKDK